MRRLALLALAAIAACADGSGPGHPDDWIAVAAGDAFTCGLTRDQRAFCWGANGFGQLGNDNNLAAAAPVPVAGGHRFTAIAVGSDHTCGLEAGGRLWCWGLNEFFELGVVSGICNGGVFGRCERTPQLVESAPLLASIQVSGYASCGLTTAGKAWCWGWSDHGQGGSGAANVLLGTPTPVEGGRTFASLSLDIYHICAITPAASLACWGSNIHGQLGADTTLTPRCGPNAPGFFCATRPLDVAAGLAVREVSAGGAHTCAIATTSGAWCWGSAEAGALGSVAAGGAVPAAVTGGADYVHVDAGYDHACALDAGGEAWCWGLSDAGQLGGPAAPDTCPGFGIPRACSRTPVAVQTPGRFIAISAGTGHTCALSAGGEIWCWGRGDSGQLGQGAFASSAIPVRVTL